jgi:hypothetical protein
LGDDWASAAQFQISKAPPRTIAVKEEVLSKSPSLFPMKYREIIHHADSLRSIIGQMFEIRDHMMALLFWSTITAQRVFSCTQSDQVRRCRRRVKLADPPPLAVARTAARIGASLDVKQPFDRRA